MTQTKTQIKTKLNQFLADIRETTSLLDFGYPSDKAIYQTILVPRANDNLDTLRAKLYLLAQTIDNLPDLDEEIANNIRYYAEQIDYEVTTSKHLDPITINDLPF